MEELEKISKRPSIHNLSRSGSHSSLHHIKESNLKVDEVDVRSKKAEDSDSDYEDEKIDAIAEEGEDETSKPFVDNPEY